MSDFPFELPEPEAGDPVVAPDEAARQLVLVKNGQRYVFRYRKGDETQMLAHLVDLAQDDGSDLDWFDAAVLSHQMGRRLGEQLQHLGVKLQ